MSDTIRAITEEIDAAGLGPGQVQVMPGDGEPDALQFTIPATCTRKSRNLLRWLGFLDVRDAIAGKRRARDTTLYLHVRGHAPTGHLVIVTVPFDETTEQAATDLIATTIEQQHILLLVARLARIETRNGDGAR